MRIAKDALVKHILFLDSNFRSISATNHTSSSNPTNLVVTIFSDFSLSDSERSVPAKSLKFVPNPGSQSWLWIFFAGCASRRIFTIKPHKDVFEVTNPKNPPCLPQKVLLDP